MPVDPSLLVAFDASVLYGPDNATPTSGAVGFVVEEGTTTHIEGSRSVDAVVSNVALEYRALLAAVRAVDDRFDRVASVHIHGDADEVINVVDPSQPAEPTGRVVSRRVIEIRDRLSAVPDVTYRALPRTLNERAHRLARSGHSHERRGHGRRGPDG
jgi:ribonuclease HI